MYMRILITTVSLVCLLPFGSASAGPKDVAIHVTRIGGDSAAAQPYIERFLRYLESAVGWPAAAAKGAFLVTQKEAMAFVANSRPGIGMMDPPLYFEMRNAWQLQPLLQVESADLVSQRFHVVVQDVAFKSMADLKGKRLWTTLADYPKYLSRVVLGGQVEATTHFQLRSIGMALKGVRGVLRGDCDATILDDEQLAKAREISGGQSLRAIYSSPALPPIPVVMFGAALSPTERGALVKALTAMCGSEKGAAICKEMHIGRFVPVNQPLFDEAQKRFAE